MLWANASPNTRFVGKRCNKIDPSRNESGRVTEPDCVDTNPATFHLSLLNQMGLHQRSFVMDSTYDAEVWNYSLLGYSLTYFNPQTLRPTNDLSQAVLPLEKFTIDKFHNLRATETKYVIGVILDVTHIAAVNPTHRSMSSGPTKTLRHYYDLELDANYNIIGGEWYMNAHPDFLWTFAKNAEAKSPADYELNPDGWTPRTAPVPSSWTAAAQRSSSAGIPLQSVIRQLVGLAEAATDSSEEHSLAEVPQSWR